MNESFNKRTICAALNAGSGDEQYRRAGAPERCGKGGYSLKRKPEEYTVGMILRLTEGSLAPVDCVEDGTDCGRADQCVTVLLWKKLNDAINGVVDNITLADLVDWQMQKANEYVI